MPASWWEGAWYHAGQKNAVGPFFLWIYLIFFLFGKFDVFVILFGAISVSALIILCASCIFTVQTVHHNAYHEDPYAKEFGIKISEKLAQVEARILPAPWVFFYWSFYWFLNFCIVFYDLTIDILSSLQLKYHDTGREKDCLPQVGQWNMMNKVFSCLLHSGSYTK